jgi:hypothetical protein
MIFRTNRILGYFKQKPRLLIKRIPKNAATENDIFHHFLDYFD